MSPDDYVNDPDPTLRRVPGTPDDVPTDLGEDAEPLSADEGSELWLRQKALIEEDEENALKLEGFQPAQVEDILEAMADDAEDVLPDSPNGTSATGAWGGPDHGGFPERGE